MPIKVQLNKEVHLYKGELTFEALLQYIQKTFKNVSQFSLYYIDEDQDEITVSCTDDLNAMIEIQKNPKLIIKKSEEILNDQSMMQSQVLSEQEIEQLVQQRIAQQKELEKKEAEQKAQQAREEMFKKREEEKKRREEEMWKKISEAKEQLIQQAKHNQEMSQILQEFQKSAKKALPHIEDFISRDLSYQGPNPNQQQQQQQENPMENMMQLMKPMFHMFKKTMKHGMGHRRRSGGPPRGPGGFGCPPPRGPPNMQGLFGQNGLGQLGNLVQSFMPAFQNEFNCQQQTVNQKLIHRGVYCDGCQQQVAGIRYKCNVCRDFDFCENCKDQVEHDHSDFQTIQHPRNQPFVDILNNVFQQPQQPQQQGEKVNVTSANDHAKIEEPQVKEEAQKEEVVEVQEEEVIISSKKQESPKVRESVIICDEQTNKKIVVSKEVQTKSKQIQEIMGGFVEDYYEVCNVMKHNNVEEIILSILEQKQQN